MMNPISQVTALYLIVVIGGSEWEWWASTWAGPQRWSISRFVGGNVMCSQERGLIGDLWLKIALHVLCFWIPLLFLTSKDCLYLCHKIQIYSPSLKSGSGPSSEFFHHICFMWWRLILEVTVKKMWQFTFDISPTRWSIPRSIFVCSLWLISCLYLPSFSECSLFSQGHISDKHS